TATHRCLRPAPQGMYPRTNPCPSSTERRSRAGLHDGGCDRMSESAGAVSADMQRIAAFRERFEAIERQVHRVIVGHRVVLRKVLAAFFAGGHVLLDGVPGLGKTLLVRSVNTPLGLSFKRIQFTPDLMPSDIIGAQILTESQEG